MEQIFIIIILMCTTKKQNKQQQYIYTIYIYILKTKQITL